MRATPIIVKLTPINLVTKGVSPNTANPRTAGKIPYALPIVDGILALSEYPRAMYNAIFPNPLQIPNCIIPNEGLNTNSVLNLFSISHPKSENRHKKNSVVTCVWIVNRN